jgi:signal transduction histidine kinase
VTDAITTPGSGDLADVSDWLARGAEAERQRARFAELAKAVPGAVGILTRRGLSFASDRLSGWLGLDVDGPTERIIARLVAPGERHRVNAAIDAAFDGRGADLEGAVELPIAHAAEPATLRLRPLRGEAVPSVLVAIDAPARRPAPALDSLRALGLYLASLSDSVQGPLTAFQDHLAALAGRGDLPAEVRESLALYRRVTDEALTRVAESLEWGRYRPSRPGVDLVEVVRAAAAAMGPSLPGRGIELHLSLGSVPPVIASAEQVQLAVEHLLRNAIEAQAERGGRIEVDLRRAGDGVAIRVSDQGPGIPPSLLPHVFDPFASSKSIVAGLGLGLPIVREVASRHGGDVSIRTGDHGTTVTVTLEMAPREERAGVSSRRSALVVDDNRDLRRTYQDLLEQAGWDVLLADGVDGALDQLERRTPDAILVDVRMTGRDGLALVEAVALWYPHLLPRLAVVTGYAAEPRVRRVAERHGLPLIEKPCPYARLLELVDRLAGAVDR